ncbi:MAG: flagellar protein FliO/FliZ [Desulforhopalus sp.]|jgi:flagellar protein FliO/FliZ
MKAIPVFLLSLLFYCSQVYAASTKQHPLLSDDSGMLAGSFRVVWGLLIVLGVILLLYGLLKKRFSLFSSLPDKEIKVVEIKPLMGKKAICLVEVRGTEYLLGISESQISTIATLPPRCNPSFSETLQAEAGDKND